MVLGEGCLVQGNDIFIVRPNRVRCCERWTTFFVIHVLSFEGGILLLKHALLMAALLNHSEPYRNDTSDRRFVELFRRPAELVVTIGLSVSVDPLLTCTTPWQSDQSRAAPFVGSCRLTGWRLRVADERTSFERIGGPFGLKLMERALDR